MARRIFEKWGASMAVVWGVAIVGVLGFFQFVSNTLLAGILCAAVIYEFFRKIDRGLPLMQIGAVLACLQWLLGPVISYASATHHDRYFMYVPEEMYFGYAIPGTAAYVFGLLVAAGGIRQRPAMHRVDRSRFITIGVTLNIISVVAEFASSRVPASLAFFIHLLSQLRYVGALYFLLSTSQWKWLLVAMSCFQLFLESAEAGMFHDLLLWSAIIFTYWFAMQRRDASLKAGILILAGLGVVLLQLVKQSMREKWSKGQTATFSSELINIVSGTKDAYSEDMLTLASARLNQGWIISAVLANVPVFEPFCDGETIKEAVKASLLPRFLMEEKKKAGGQENFRRFAGLSLEDNTSMGLSILGEGYANFGKDGGILFMGIAGACFALSYRLLTRRVLRHPTFLFWIPLIYYQAVKAETELVVVMNQVVKGFVVAFGGFWLCEQYLKRATPLEFTSAQDSAEVGGA